MTFREWHAKHDPWAATHRDHKAAYSERDMEAAWEAGRGALLRELAILALEKKTTPAEAGAEGALSARWLTPR